MPNILVQATSFHTAEVDVNVHGDAACVVAATTFKDE